MNNLRLIPDTHRPQEIIRASFAIDKKLIGNPNRKQYSASSIGAILSDAAKKANIPKNVYPHILRHSFATHRLELGISLRHILTLLGHSSSQTTATYTQVATQEIGKIKNPLDDFYTSESSTIPTN